jgi:hypothetical protein
MSETKQYREVLVAANQCDNFYRPDRPTWVNQREIIMGNVGDEFIFLFSAEQTASTNSRPRQDILKVSNQKVDDGSESE